MQIVVTGQLGFIGSHLMEQLPPETIGLDIKEGNDILSCALPDADVVIHLAAEPDVLKSMKYPITSAETNVMGTLRLIQRYKKAKFIFASSGGAIQETIESPYGLSKYVAERYIKLLHKNAVILRFGNVYGVGSRSVVDKFLGAKDEVTIYGDGTATRSYVHVDDIIQGIIQSLGWKPGRYHLGSNDNYTVLQIAEAIGKKIKFTATKKGELTHSSVMNSSPDWESYVRLIDYIRRFK